MRVETVSIVYKHPLVLLGMKKGRKFGRRLYNGFGGGVRIGKESLEESAIRETWEEAGIRLLNLEKMGKILFTFRNDEQNHLVYFFKTKSYSGVPKETKEMKPEWFYIRDVPYDQMWPDDKHWLPLFLEGKHFRGIFHFDATSPSGIGDFELKEIDKL